MVIFLYFINNPLRHGRWFMMRRFINWFPLGMIYAFLYMGRYNLTVAKNSLGVLMSKEDFGTIFAAGTATYSGIIDGCVYLGSSLQSVGIGYLAGQNWLWWPLFLMPFALTGSILAFRFWHELPAATKRFNAERAAAKAGR